MLLCDDERDEVLVEERGAEEERELEREDERELDREEELELEREDELELDLEEELDAFGAGGGVYVFFCASDKLGTAKGMASARTILAMCFKLILPGMDFHLSI